MGNYTREEILAMAEEEDVEFIRLQFTDMFGTLKNIAITARELPRALDNQCVVYGSHIAGIVGEKEPDLILYPDYDTFSILPWRPQQGKVARLICDMRRADGSEHEMSSRYILKKTAQAAEEAGYTCYVDPECEFFLFHIDDNGMPTTVSHEKAGYLDVSPVDLGENARRDMVLTLEDMGFEVESSHHETAPAQHEIALHYGEAREMADEVLAEGTDAAIIACGEMVRPAYEAAKLLEKDGIHATVLDMYCVKPLDKEAIVKAASNAKVVVTAEEHAPFGGLGSMVSQVVGAECPRKVLNIALPDAPVVSGTSQEVFDYYGMNAEGIAKTVKDALK